jgi:hypothetical protein
MLSEIKIGLVGLDTSHCTAFTGILNERNNEYSLAGARVVGAYPGGSVLFSLCRERLKGLTEEISNRYGIPLYSDLVRLAADVDALFLLSGDGRQHLEQFRQMAVGKPVFIDKILAASSTEARLIVQLAEATGTPILACSALRYAAGIAGPLPGHESALACEAFGPAYKYPDYPGLFWYGIHPVEILFSFMGSGCRKVMALSYPDLDVLVGEWQDGRRGVVHATRYDQNPFGCVIHTRSASSVRTLADRPPVYFSLMQKVLEFVRSGESPVSVAEMFNVVAFLEAANESCESGQLVELVELA